MEDHAIPVYRDGKRSPMKVSGLAFGDGSLQRIDLATCPGRHCICPSCRAMKERIALAAKAPLGQKFTEGPSYVGVIFAGRSKIKLLGLFTTLSAAVAYCKANYKCQPLGTTRFATKDGDVLIVQEHVHILNLGET